MGDQITSKRQFVKQILFLSVLYGIKPVKALAGIIDNEVIPDDLIDEAMKDAYAFRRQVNNQLIMSQLSREEKETQYQGLLSILATAENPAFKNASKEEKLKILKESKPFAPGETEKRPKQELWPAIYLMGGLALATIIITRGKVLGLAALGRMAVNVPQWMTTTGEVLDSGLRIYGGYKIAESVLTDSSVAAGEAVSSSLFNSFLSTSEYNLQNELEGLRLQIGDRENTGNTPSPTGNENESVGGLLEFLMDRTGRNRNIFNDPDEFEQFIEEYTVLLGGVQEKLLEKILEARRKEDEARLTEARNRVAFVESLQEFIGVAVIDKMASAKEAAILRTLLSTGFEMGSTITPIGWATVGIKLATIMSTSEGSHHFEKAVMAALRNIQKQLNVLIENVEIINQNQIIVLKQLQTLISKIDDIKDFVGAKFEAIALQQRLIYDLVKVGKLQELQGEIEEKNRRLGYAVNNKNSTEQYQFIQELAGIALQKLNTKTVTRYQSGYHSSDSLKHEIVFESGFQYQISLYDSIGLTSALSNYVPGTFGGFSDQHAIVHPILFSQLVDFIVNWIILSDLSPSDKQSIAKDLLEKASVSNRSLVNYCQKNVVDKLATQYYQSARELLGKIRDEGNQYLRQTYKGKLLQGRSALLTGDINYNAYINHIKFKRDNPKNFYDDFYDDIFVSFAVELGVIKQLRRIKTDDYRAKSPMTNVRIGTLPHRIIPAFNVGGIVGSKTNQLIIENALLNAKTKQLISLQLTYVCNLRVRTFELIERRDLVAPFDHIVMYKEVTSTTGSFVIEKDWKAKVKQQAAAQHIDISKTIKDFDKPNFDFQKFLGFLMDQQVAVNKAALIDHLKKYILNPTKSEFDGLGISIMFLSKLNKVVTRGDASDFLLEYPAMAYIREDLCSILDEISSWDLSKATPGFPHPITEEFVKYDDFSSLYNIQDYDEEISINYLFMELIVAVLHKTVVETYQKTSRSLREADAQSGDPFLLNVISKLNGLRNLIADNIHQEN